MKRNLRWILVSILVFSLSFSFLLSETKGLTEVDLMIIDGTIITMDGERRVIEDGALAISGDRIVDVGLTGELQSKYRPKRTINAKNKVVMPGLIDGHGHSGHTLVKTMGMGRARGWWEACERIYAEGSDEDFWRADALLAALERLKFGVTCGITYFGGGDSIMRTDDPKYGDLHLAAVKKVGIREFLAVGPRRPPFPRKFSHWDGENRQDVLVSFEQQLKTCKILIERWHGEANGRLNLCMMFPVHHSERDTPTAAELEKMKHQANAVRDLTKKYGLLFTQDGHTSTTIKFAHEELGILGPDSLLSHCTEITDEEIQICKANDIKVIHNPSANYSIRGRCPVTELLDAGVTVMLGSDATGPDRSYDMFRHMFQCMRYHRFHFRDANVLPAGKVLEMVTIDAARALGLEDEIGSLESGKKADVILIDMFKPHLVPANMPVHRVAYFANGNDVDTVIVDGQILMENRKVNTVNEAEVIELAEKAIADAIKRTNLQHLLTLPERFWGVSNGAPQLEKRVTEAEANTITNGVLKIWNKADFSKAHDLYAPGYVRHHPTPSANVSFEDFKNTVIALHDSFPDCSFTFNDTLIEDDKIIVFATFTGTNTGPLEELPPTGKKASVSGVYVFRIAEGKIAEEWTYFNLLSYYQQLGFTLAPPSPSNPRE
jgi:5-methylthioadenosine/S-adenosylhomocysteine deaminase